MCTCRPGISTLLVLPCACIWCIFKCCIIRAKKVFTSTPHGRQQYQEQSDEGRKIQPEKQRQLWTEKCKSAEAEFQRNTPLSVVANRNTYNEQSQSDFFRSFPVEIRRKIYVHVLNDESFLHLTAAGNRFIVPGCANEECPLNPCQFHLEANEDAVLFRHMRCMETFDSSWEYNVPVQLSAGLERLSPSRLHFVNLLRSCRKIYIEANDLLYNQKTFVLSVNFHFRAWARSIPARHLDMVRYLVLHVPTRRLDDDDWQDTVQIMAKMERLQDCRIVIADWGAQFGPIMATVHSVGIQPGDGAFVVDLIETLNNGEERLYSVTVKDGKLMRWRERQWVTFTPDADN